MNSLPDSNIVRINFEKHHLLAVLAIIAIAASLRLYGLTAIGVGGNDTILYYSLAEQWLQGNFVFQIGASVQVFRPVVLGLNALALWLFGHTDYALKLGGVLFDCANVVLLSYLAWLVSRRPLVVLACAFSYALLPIAVWASRQELPHTISTFFVLASCVFIAKAISAPTLKSAALALLLAGASIGLAALCHEELILLTVPLIAFLGFARTTGGGNLSPKEALQRVGIFTCAPLLAAALVLLAQFAAVQAVVRRMIGAASENGGFWIEKFPRFVWDVIVGSTSATMAFALALCAVYILWSGRRRAPKVDPEFRRWASFCLLLPIAHTAIYALFFDVIFPRGFLPLVPLLIITVFLCLTSLLANASKAMIALATVATVTLLVLSNLASYSAFNVGNRRFSATWAAPVWPNQTTLVEGSREFLADARYVPGYGTYWGALYRALEGAVDADNRLLLLPSTSLYSPGRRAPQLQVYFGDHAIYRLDHVDQSLDQLVRNYNLKWVVFTAAQLRGEPASVRPYRYNGEWAAESAPVDLARAYGLDAYSAQAEYRLLLEYLNRVGAAQVDLFAADSYEYQVTRVFRLR